MSKLGDKFYGQRRRLSAKINAIMSVGSSHPVAIFRSARIKLTAFYFAIIVVFAVVLTFSVLELAQHEFGRAGLVQQGKVRNLFAKFYSVPPPNDFDQVQAGARRLVRERLKNDVIIVDEIAIVIGGILSYWYAGRTLRPIERANRAQARFAADASHELRTPLAAMRIESEVFLRQAKFTSAQARQQISSNLEEIQRLENLANMLLALTAYEQVELELAAVDIKKVVASALAALAKVADSKQVKFSKLFESEAFVLGNFDSLVQLAGIILDNAVKYGPAGSQVFIECKRSGDSYNLNVRDQGPGIDEQDLPYIFDRLYRGDKARGSSTPGYGLGLSLAREIARANRGRVVAGNNPAGGSQITIILPLA